MSGTTFTLTAADEARPTVRDIAREALEEGLDEGDTLVRMRAAVRTPEDLARWLAAQLASDGCEVLAAAHLDLESELGDLVDHLDVQLNEGWARAAALEDAVREAAAAAGLPLTITTERERVVSLGVRELVMALGEAARLGREEEVEVAQAQGRLARWRAAQADLGRHVQRVRAALEGVELVEGDGLLSLDILRDMITVTQAAQQQPGEASTDPAPAGGEAPGGLAVLRPQVQPAVVEMVQDLLRRAEQGEVQGLGVVIAGADRSVLTSFALGDGGVAALGFGAFDLACRLRGEG